MYCASCSCPVESGAAICERCGAPFGPDDAQRLAQHPPEVQRPKQKSDEKPISKIWAVTASIGGLLLLLGFGHVFLSVAYPIIDDRTVEPVIYLLLGSSLVLAGLGAGLMRIGWVGISGANASTARWQLSPWLVLVLGMLFGFAGVYSLFAGGVVWGISMVVLSAAACKLARRRRAKQKHRE